MDKAEKLIENCFVSSVAKTTKNINQSKQFGLQKNKRHNTETGNPNNSRGKNHNFFIKISQSKRSTRKNYYQFGS